jgi:hypothetical protein
LKIGDLTADASEADITGAIKGPITNIENALKGLNSSLGTLSENINNENGPYKNISSIVTTLTGNDDGDAGFVGKIDTVKQSLASVNSALKKILGLKIDQSVQDIASSNTEGGSSTNAPSNSVQKIIGALNGLNTSIGTTEANNKNPDTSSLSGAVTSFKGTLSALLGDGTNEGIFGTKTSDDAATYTFISNLTLFKDILKSTNTALKGILALKIDDNVKKISEQTDKKDGETSSEPLKTTIIKDAIVALNASLGKNEADDSFYKNVKDMNDKLKTYFDEVIFGDLVENKYAFAKNLESLKAVLNQSHSALKGIGGINIDKKKLGAVDYNAGTIRTSLRALDMKLGTGKEGSAGPTMYSIISG